MRALLRAIRSHPRAALAIVLTTLIGGAARLATVTWGDPFLFHPDERGFVMWEAASIEWRGLTHGDWRPETTTYGPVIYELALALKWTFLGGIEHARRQASESPDAWAYVHAGIEAWDDGDPFSFLAWTQLVRTFGALASAIAIALLAAAAWRLEGARAGVVTAVLAASSVGLLQAAHYATTDSLVLVEIAMLLHACAGLARRGGWGNAIYAGLSVGLIAATKSSGLLLLAAVPIAIASSPGASGAPWPDRALARRWLGRSLAALATSRFVIVVAVMVATYAALCPWAFFERELYFGVPANRSGAAVLMSQYTDHDYEFYDWRFTYNGTVPYLYLITHVLPYAVGVPILIAAALELARSIGRGAASARIALFAALPTFLLVGMWGVKTIRYALPSVPGLLLAASFLLARAIDRGGASRAIAGVAIALVLARGVAFTAMFLEPDPRTLAGRWLDDHAAPGDVIVLEPEASYTAPLGGNEDGVGVDRPARRDIRVRRLWSQRPAPSAVAAHVDSTLRGARYLVIGEWYLRRGLHPEAPVRAPEQARFYRALTTGELPFRRVAAFPRAPRLGPFAWDESDAEILAVCFDHMPVYVYERVE
jgi:hypothetical protein